MGVQTRTAGDVLVAELAGSVDGQTVPAIQASLSAALGEVTRAVLLMSQVTFLSSAGLRLLLLVYRHVKAKGGKVGLVGVSDEIKDVMETTGFLPYFEFADSEEGGLAAVRA